MNIDQKINYRENAFLHLTSKQYFQLIDSNRLVLAPYYLDRLISQGRHVQQSEGFKAIYGKYRFEYENNI